MEKKNYPKKQTTPNLDSNISRAEEVKEGETPTKYAKEEELETPTKYAKEEDFETPTKYAKEEDLDTPTKYAKEEDFETPTKYAKEEDIQESNARSNDGINVRKAQKSSNVISEHRNRRLFESSIEEVIISYSNMIERSFPDASADSKVNLVNTMMNNFGIELQKIQFDLLKKIL